MTDMIAVAVVDLKAGPALDWAVAKAAGYTDIELTTEFASKTDGSQGAGLAPWIAGDRRPFKPSTSWLQGGSLIEGHDVASWHILNGKHTYTFSVGDAGAIGVGSTMLESACIAIVKAKFSDAVSVPKALLGGV